MEVIMKLVLSLLAVLVIAAFAQDPANILIYHDVRVGYGDTVDTAAQALWSSANVESYTGEPGGQQTAFNTALDGGTDWDIVVLECWYANTNDIDWASLLAHYNAGDFILYVSNWQWNTGSSGQAALATAMGVSSISTFSGSVIPHYAWEPSHQICTGITDWGWADPGIGILNCKFTVSDATPLTGWTNSAAVGEAGICVANDGYSVISGYALAYANQADDLWTNVYNFMWRDTALSRDTWAGIKASF
jgi:hypothetical protein